MTETTHVSPRARATLPRGFADRDAGDLAAAEAMMAKIGEVYALYGFEAVETPAIEYTDALGNSCPTSPAQRRRVLVQDDDEQWMSLRYDLTAPLARYVAENSDRCRSPTAAIGRAGVPQREAGAGALSRVHAVRRRHGRLGFARRRRRNVHDGL